VLAVSAENRRPDDSLKTWSWFVIDNDDGIVLGSFCNISEVRYVSTKNRR